MEALRIEISINARTGRFDTNWITAGSPPRTVPTSLHKDALVGLRLELGRQLQKAKDEIGSSLQPTWDQINASVVHLRKTGSFLMTQLFPQNAFNVIETWREQMAPFLLDPSAPPVVKIVGPDIGGMDHPAANLLLPWEFLPLFSDNARHRRQINHPIDSNVVLANEMAQYVVHRCIVSRVLGEFGEQMPGPGGNPLAPVKKPDNWAKLFTCRTLQGPQIEEKRLRQLGRGRIRWDAWPRRQEKGTAAQMAAFMWRVTHCTRGRKRKTSDRIHHFASHFTVTSSEADQQFFTIAGCDKTAFKASLFELLAEIGNWNQQEPLPSKGGRPLVFVNACASSTINPQGVASLPNLFFGQLRSRGFIGTETTMSDGVATEFAAEFYRRFIDGASLGRALYDARRALVEKFRNPLGLYYTCYAHPELSFSSLTSN